MSYWQRSLEMDIGLHHQLLEFRNISRKLLLEFIKSYFFIDTFDILVVYVDYLPLLEYWGKDCNILMLLILGIHDISWIYIVNVFYNKDNSWILLPLALNIPCSYYMVEMRKRLLEEKLKMWTDCFGRQEEGKRILVKHEVVNES